LLYDGLRQDYGESGLLLINVTSGDESISLENFLQMDLSQIIVIFSALICFKIL
jgi:hypothetical protein